MAARAAKVELVVVDMLAGLEVLERAAAAAIAPHPKWVTPPGTTI
jgi:hypothetical protein